MKKSLKYLDLAIKIEVTLSEMTSLLVRTSVFEISMFFVGLFLLL